LFDSQHGLIGPEKSDTLQKLVARQPEPDPQKEKNKIKEKILSICESTAVME
jgi:hypothetical protein